MGMLVRNVPGVFAGGRVFFVVWCGWNEGSMGSKKVGGKTQVAGELSEAVSRMIIGLGRNRAWVA